MAYDASSDQEQDPEKTNNQGPQSTPGEPSTTLSGGGGGFAGQGGATSSGAPGSYDQKPTTSGNWTNLNTYLSANADQAPGLGNALASNVSGQAQKAQGDLSQVQQGFQNQAPYSDINNTTSSAVDSAFSDPSKYANGGDTSTAEKYLNNGWGINSSNSDITQYAPASGPSDQTAQDEYLTAGQGLKNTQSESGRDLLLQNQFGNNGTNYGTGLQNFDQLLLQQNPDNQNKLNSLYSQYAPGILAGANTGGVPTDIYNSNQAAQDYNTKEQGLASGYQTQAAKALSDQISGLGTQVGTDVTNANTGYGSSASQVAQDIASGKLTSEEADAYGIHGPIDTYGVKASSYLNPAASNPYTANTAATADDRAKYSGLNALVSGYSGTDRATDGGNLLNLGLTDTAPAINGIPSATSQFDSSAFNTAIGLAKNKYNDQNSNILGAFNKVGPASFSADPFGGGLAGHGYAAPAGADLSAMADFYNNLVATPGGQQELKATGQWDAVNSALNDYQLNQAQNTYFNGSAPATSGPSAPIFTPAPGNPPIQIRPPGLSLPAPLAPAVPKTFVRR